MKTRWTLSGITIKPKLRHRTVAVWAPMMLALIPLAVLYVPQQLSLFLLAIVLFNLVAGVATMPHNHLHLKYAKSKRTSVDVAFYKTIAQLGKLVAVPASTLIYSLYGIQGCLIASIVVLLLSASFALLLSKRTVRPSGKTSRALRPFRAREQSIAMGTVACIVLAVVVLQLPKSQGMPNMGPNFTTLTIPSERKEVGELELQIANHHTVRGLVEGDNTSDGSVPLLLIDDRKFTWEELGRMLMNFEGRQFKLEMRELSEEH
ncbi:MAG: DUF7713 domain-containing protein [Pseudomonadales bacterium]